MKLKFNLRLLFSSFLILVDSLTHFSFNLFLST